MFNQKMYWPISAATLTSQGNSTNNSKCNTLFNYTVIQIVYPNN